MQQEYYYIILCFSLFQISVYLNERLNILIMINRVKQISIKIFLFFSIKLSLLKCKTMYQIISWMVI